METTIKKIGTVHYVTDTDVSYIKRGEVWASFEEEELKEYIKQYGHEKLCAKLAYMQFQVWKTLREINSEKGREDAGAALSKNSLL